MPTYEYRCKSCDHRWEEFQSITTKPSRKCPDCSKLKAERIISAGGGIIFKGSGFYQTDYRSESYKKGASEDKKSREPKSTETKSAESGKPAANSTKSESSASKPSD